MNAAKHMEAALRTDVEYCRRKMVANPVGNRTKVKGGVLFIGVHPDIASMYERQYNSAVARLETWLAEHGQ